MKIVKSQLNEFIKKYGLNNNLGEYGQKISGGEKQKIALARTLYRSPEVLLFDEVTSAFDYKARNNLFIMLKNI